ncbi:DUF4302 domain-containing protein [Marinilabiliaceae bacterium JC017]|nr:DUF4302 domain-containing protein [Marinilabiliaceae bacterium JC017]
MRNLIYIILGAALFFSACQEDDDHIFDQSSDARLNEQLKEYSDILVSAEHGWKTDYYPNPELLGGYSFVMKYNNDGTVETVWDIRTGKDKAMYALKSIERPELVIETYNVFSKMTDPEIGEPGVGMGGDIELFFERVSEKGDSIYFTGKAQGAAVVFYKATEADWSEIDLLKNMEAKVISQEGVHPFFRNLVFEGSDTKYMMTYDDDKRRINWYYTDAKGETQIFNVGVHYTADGFVINKPIIVNGKEVRTFKYDTDKKVFKVSDEGVSGSLIYEATPPAVFNGAYDMYFGKKAYDIKKYSDVLVTKLEGLNDIGTFNYFHIEAWGKYGFEHVSFNYVDYKSAKFDTKSVKAAEDHVVFSYKGEPSYGADLNEEFMASPACKAVYDFYFDPAGFTVVPQSTIEYNESCWLVSKSDPTLYFFCAN